MPIKANRQRLLSLAMCIFTGSVPTTAPILAQNPSSELKHRPGQANPSPGGALAAGGQKPLSVQQRVAAMVKTQREHGYCTSARESCTAWLSTVENDGRKLEKLGLAQLGQPQRDALLNLIGDTIEYVKALSRDHPEYSEKVAPYIKHMEENREKAERGALSPGPVARNSCSVAQIRPAAYNVSGSRAAVTPVVYGCSGYFYICVVGCAGAAAAAGAACLALPPPLDAACLAGVYIAESACELSCSNQC